MVLWRLCFFILVSVALHTLVFLGLTSFQDKDEVTKKNIDIVTFTTKNNSTKANPQKWISSQKNIDLKNLSQENNIETYQDTPAIDSEITSPAVLLTKIQANRTEAARKADYAGVAKVEIIIASDGSVQSTKLQNSLPYGLDEVALKLARDLKFKPAMVKNKPVASAILLKVRFESEK